MQRGGEQGFKGGSIDLGQGQHVLTGAYMTGGTSQRMAMDKGESRGEERQLLVARRRNDSSRTSGGLARTCSGVASCGERSENDTFEAQLEPGWRIGHDKSKTWCPQAGG